MKLPAVSLGRDAVAVLALKVTAAALRFATSFALVAWLGAAGFGAVSYAVAWVSFLAVPAVVGLDVFSIRQVAACRDEEPELLPGFRRWAEKISFGISLLLAGAVAAAVWTIEFLPEEGMVRPLLIALTVLPALALTRVRQGMLTGLEKIIPGQIPDGLVRPLMFLSASAALHYASADGLTPDLAAASFAGGVVAALIVATVYLRGARSWTPQIPPPDAALRRSWRQGTLPLVSMALLHVILAQIDLLMLGPLRGAAETGIYAIVAQGATLLSMVLVAVNTPLGPRIARLDAAGEREEIQRLAVRWARLATAAALVPGLFFIVYGDFFLGLFGAEIVAGRRALAILVVGQLVNIAMGSVALLLVMTGHGRDAAWGVAAGAVLNILLNAFLIPRYGLDGAAVASSVSVVTWNLLLYFRVRRRLGISSSILGSGLNLR